MGSAEPTVPAGHAGCAQELRDNAARNGAQVDVHDGTFPFDEWLDPFRSKYLAEFVCPHGQHMWIIPTSKQIEDWRARGVR